MITNSIIIAFFIYLIIKHVFYGNPIIEGVTAKSDSNAASIKTIGVTQESHTQQIKKLTDKYKTLQGLLNDNRIKTAIQTNAANSTLANKLKACAKKK